MRDYTELVKALRGFDVGQSCPCETPDMCNENDCMVYQAADAIEELIKTSRRWELEAAANEKEKQYFVDENRRLVDSLMNLLVQKWISVEERLPEKEVRVLCACRANIFCVMKWDGIDWYENPTHIYMSGFVTH